MKNLELKNMRVLSEVNIHNIYDLVLSIKDIKNEVSADIIDSHHTGLMIAYDELGPSFVEGVIKQYFDKLYSDHKIIPEVGDNYEIPLDFIIDDGNDAEVVWIGVEIQKTTFDFESACYNRITLIASMHC